MSCILSMIAVVYLSVATVVPDPHNFVNCYIVGWLAAAAARNSWEDTQ